ncbi:MAG: HAD family phosphatase [Lachnospiraceae bacterium]|jgi:HAD superfamily hydrolase (TIGR01509 family)|nr:HAD family phosphatase [Lachnospiraceae bacterium]
MKIRVKDFRSVIFDLDGTLVDSMGMWSDIDVEYLARFGIACPPNLQRDLEGLSFKENAVYFRERFHLKDPTEKIGQDWLDMSAEKYRTSIRLKPGVREFLEYLKKENISAAIASSNHYGLIADCLRSNGILEDFRAIITCDDVSANKPDPSVYLEAARRLGSEPSACLVFEDIPIGIEAGKNAGMTVCAVEDLYSASVAEQKSTLADFVIADFRELIPGNER